MISIKFKELKKHICKIYRRNRLKNKNFTIISDNCWGGFVYQYFGLKYNTPFIGLFLFSPDYINLLKNFNQVISNELKFIEPEESRYKDILKSYGTYGIYPIGILNKNIEIHFLHYKTEQEALQKWTNRVKRINYDKILFKFCDRDLCSEKLIKEFDNLNLNNKICFTSKKYDYDCVVKIEECDGMPCVSDEWIYYNKYIDIIKVINSL